MSRRCSQLETYDGPAHYAAMHNEHSTAGQAQHPASDSRLKVMEAIARRKTVEAQYNGKRIKLAPHMLFERRGDLFVSALNMSKSWRSEEEQRLGQFKLSGLGEPDLLDEGFDPLPSFDPATTRDDDRVILAI